jgi:hypothetical protein
MTNSRDPTSNISPRRRGPGSKSRDKTLGFWNRVQTANLMNQHTYTSRIPFENAVNNSGPDEVEVAKARSMALDLIATVRQAYEAHRSGGPPPSAPSASPPAQPPPTQLVPPGVNAPPGMSYPGASDPYAAYGGYQAYQQYCIPLSSLTHVDGSYYAQQSPPVPGAPGAGSSPPPPGMSGNGYPAPANVISPPPPPGASSYGGQYSAMPPPPGV